MSNILYDYLANDHDRIEALFQQAVGENSTADSGDYDVFRKALLRHISIEEKIVFPALRRLQWDAGEPVIRQLRLDHSALVTLLVPSPTVSVIASLSAILKVHNALEEQADGIYATLDRLAGESSPVLLERFQTAAEVPVLPTKPLSQVIDAVTRAVKRAGYEFIEEAG